MPKNNIATTPTHFNELGTVLLEVGTLLMGTGASTERIRITISRISESFGYISEVLITNKALMLTISDKNYHPLYTHLKRSQNHEINFKMISGISRMSWSVVEEKWTLNQIQTEVHRLKNLKPYPRWVVLTIVALAGASFCRLFQGDAIAMVVTFISTFLGLWVRQETTKRKFNFYLCTYFAAFTASFISGLFMKLNVSPQMDHAVAASVLFLIPGIALIHTFTDILDGNLLNGLLRGMNGLILIFSVAQGMLTSLLFFHLSM